jgi:drug/metabolite transporter (DMT)-like permease
MDNSYSKFTQIHSDFSSFKESENFYLFIYALSPICYGVNGFHMKYSSLFIKNYDMNSFLLWRSLSTLLIPYYLIYKNQIQIIPLKEIENRFWFFIRTVGQLIFLISYILSMRELRAGTTSSIMSLNPIVVIILGTFLLKEKFHIRYLIGISICFLASLLIISSDKKQSQVMSNQNIDVIKGVLWAILSLIFAALISVSSKILAKENICWRVQCFYLGVSNIILNILYSIFNDGILISFEMIFHGILNGFSFIAGTICLVESLKKIDLNKTTSLIYLNCVTVFILGYAFLNEQIYFLDVLGSFIIVGYNLYNSVYPVK